MISDEKKFHAFCAQARLAKALGLDLEFHGEHTYHPKLCLIQLTTGAESLVVDPLEQPYALDPLHDLIADPEIEIIVHSGRTDMEILYQLSKRPPRRVFDTQIAAALLGMGEQVGYGVLVEALTGVKLDKTETYSDWAQRPLTSAQVTYALDDVRYLFKMRDELHRRLEAKGRRSWLDEETSFYETAATYQVDPQEAWQRLARQAYNMEGRSLSVLRELAAWREVSARASNVTRGSILKDDFVIQIARRLPKQPQDLAALRSLPKGVISRSGPDIVAAVAKGAARPASEWPKAPARPRQDLEVSAALDLMQVMLKRRALDAEIAAPYLGSAADLTTLLDWVRAGKPAATTPLLFQGWRRELVGEALVALAEGRAALRLDDATRRVTIAA